jgi:O-antigen ligase
MALAAVVALLAFVSCGGKAATELRWPMALFTLAIAVQLIPLPPVLLAVISPKGAGIVMKLDEAYAAAPTAHALSIAPGATAQALALFVALSVLLLGLTKLFSATGTRWFAASVSFLGVGLALFGIGQKFGGNGLVYGVWEPSVGGGPFGPFINRNHFAGWLLMALPVTLALLSERLARGLRYVRPTLRDRFFWLSSGQAGGIVVSGAAIAVMSMALVLTLSRSGMSAVLLTVVLTALVARRGMRAKAKHRVLVLFLVALVVFVGLWVGRDAIATRFSADQWTGIGGRLRAWKVAWTLVRQFPLVGTGLNTFGSASLLYWPYEADGRLNQAHSDYFQLAAEGGVLLLVPAVLLATSFCVAVARRFRDDEQSSFTWWIRAGAVMGIASMALQETVEFSLQMPGNAVLFVALCAVAVHHSGSRRSAKLPRT